MSEDRFEKVRKNINLDQKASRDNIVAKELNSQIVQNFKLLQSIISGEKVSAQWLSDQESSAKKIEQIKQKIITEMLKYPLNELALIKIPRKYHKDCFECLTLTFRHLILKEYQTTLTFENIVFSDDTFRAFITALILNVNLKALNLTNCQLDYPQIYLLSILLRLHPSLEYFHLVDNPIDQEALKLIISSINQSLKITSVSLVSLKIDDKMLSPLKGLLENKQLKYINLSKNELSEKVREELQQNAKDCKLHLS